MGNSRYTKAGRQPAKIFFVQRSPVYQIFKQKRPVGSQKTLKHDLTRGKKARTFVFPIRNKGGEARAKPPLFRKRGKGSASRQNTKNIFPQVLDKRNKKRTFVLPNERDIGGEATAKPPVLRKRGKG